MNPSYSELIQLLLKNDLVDEIRLKIHPLTLGKGKKILQKGTISAAFKLTGSIVTSTGVIIASYKRAGKVKTGTVGAWTNITKTTTILPESQYIVQLF
jgi:dihydrofolate reductase